MPYTNPWSDIIPAGTDPANTIDDQIRQLRLDIHDRMDHVVADWTDDPVVPLSGSNIYSALGAAYEAVNYLTIAFAIFTSTTGVIVFDLDDVNTLAGGGVDWQVSNMTLLDMPVSFVGIADIFGTPVPVAIKSFVKDSVENTVTITFIRASDEGVLNTKSITGSITFGFVP